jgi:FAD/FMN-containing dehydrogenase
MIELSAITKEYYDFINQVKQAGFSIPFFSGPPANVVGNISSNGVGFFAAYSSSFAKTIVK